MAALPIHFIEPINIRNLQTMIRTLKTIPTACFALMTILLLLFFGLPKAFEKDAFTYKSGPTESKTHKIVFTPVTTDPDAVRQPSVIKGDLDTVDWDSLVGQDVIIKGDLVVIDTFDLIRRGQVKVARKRLFVPTSRIDPNDADPDATSFEGGSNVAEVVKAQKYNDNATLTIDDGSTKQNILPPTLFPGLGKTHPTVRVGSVINGASGRLVKAGRNLLLVPNQPLRWTPAERPQRPDIGDANVTVSSFNVLNYFTTIDDGSNNARGADSDVELKRQEAKIVSAIIELKADVVGLMELENNLDAEVRLVAALNKKMRKKVFKGCGLAENFRWTPGGGDAIRVGIIYRSDRVKPIGDVQLIADKALAGGRTPVVQRFKAKRKGKPFTVIVNHFKSKGGADRADTANKNKGDGQGAFNATRRNQALAICNYINQLKRGSKQPRVLVIGDLNAYEQEDPIDAMRAKGLVDLHEQFEKDGSSTNRVGPYSYVYRGQSGSLDHAFATEALAADVTGVAVWHINADEPRFLDYNQEYNPKALYDTGPFRSSDHDPVLIGIEN